MANRFNQLISQQYVPIPFQEVAQAAAIRQKTADANAAALDQEMSELNKLKAIPNTPQEEYLRQYLGQVNDAFQKFSSPEMLSNPNNALNFRKHVRSITDPIRLNNIQASWKTWESDLENRRKLTAENKFRPELVPSVSNLQPTDVFTDATPAYELSQTYTDKMYQGFQEQGVVVYNPDGSSYVSTERSPENLRLYAAQQKKNFANHPWLRTYAKLEKGMDYADFEKLPKEEKEKLAEEVMINDWITRYEKTAVNQRRLPKALSQKTAAERGKEEKALDIVDPAGLLVDNTSDSAVWTPEYLSTAFKNKFNTNDPVAGGQSSIQVNPSKAFNVMPIRGNMDPRVVKLQQLLKKAKADEFKATAEKSEAFKRFNPATPIHAKYSREMLPLREQILTVARDLGLPEQEFDIMGRNTDKAFEKFYVDNLIMDNDALYKAQQNFNKKFGITEKIGDHNAGGDTKIGLALKSLNSGRFVPRDTGNKIAVDNPVTGVTEHYITGDFVLTEGELTEKAKAAGFNDADEFLERLKDVQDRFGYAEGEIIQSGDPISIVNSGDGTEKTVKTYKIQGYVPVPTSDDVMDEFNRSALGDKYNSETTNQIRSLRAEKMRIKNADYERGQNIFRGDVVAEKAKAYQAIDELTPEDFDFDISEAELEQLKKAKKDNIEQAIKTGSPSKLGNELNEIDEVSNQGGKLVSAIGEVENSFGSYDDPPTTRKDSNGNIIKGTASGKYQFIDSTWQSYAEPLGISAKSAYLASKKDQDRVMKAAIKDYKSNAKRLMATYGQYKGFPFDENDLVYLMHAVGSADLSKMLDAYVANAGDGHSAGMEAMKALDKDKNRNLEQTLEKFRKKLK